MKTEIVPLLAHIQDKNTPLQIIEELKSLTLFSVDVALLNDNQFKHTSLGFDWMTGDVVHIEVDIVGKQGQKLYIEADIPEIESIISIGDLEKFRAMILIIMYLNSISGFVDSTPLQHSSSQQLIRSLEKIERILLSKNSLGTSTSDQTTTD